MPRDARTHHNRKFLCHSLAVAEVAGPPQVFLARAVLVAVAAEVVGIDQAAVTARE